VIKSSRVLSDLYGRVAGQRPGCHGDGQDAGCYGDQQDAAGGVEDPGCGPYPEGLAAGRAGHHPGKDV